jgi:dihydropyrimidinase
MLDILITNGLIHTSDKVFKGDILISNGRINLVEEKIHAVPKSFMTIDASGKLIFPGGIDPHVHMELPSPAGNSCDDFYTGSRAALAGGTTTMIDFVTPARGESLISAFKERKKLAQKSLIDHAFHVSPTWWGKDSAKEMEILVKEFGVNSFKCYLAYQNTIGINDEVLMKVMKTAGKLDSIVTLHCETDEIIQKNIARFVSEGKTAPKFHPLSRPPEAEILAVKKAIRLASETGCRIYIVHVSTAGALELIKKAQKSGMEIHAETCPQYLLLDDRIYDQVFEKSAPFVMSPPLRKKEDQDALWEGIADGTIHTVGTDHCPFNLNGQKDKGIDNFTLIPNGAGGVEHRLGLLYTYGVLANRISIGQFIKVISENPASIFKLKNKGSVRAGFDADLVIWNPLRESVISAKTQFQNCDSNIYEGMKIRGKPEITICKGEIAFTDGKIKEEELCGNYLKRSVN